MPLVRRKTSDPGALHLRCAGEWRVEERRYARLSERQVQQSRYVRNELKYDALVLISFGGPERPEDVIPFLENVLRGRNVPRERMLEVAGHYYHVGGCSPINGHCRDLISELRNQVTLPVYWGNR